MTGEENEERGTRERKLLVKKVVNQMPANMELDFCPSGSRRMRYINHVAHGVQDVVSTVDKESDESIDMNGLDDGLVVNVMEKRTNRQKTFTRLVRQATKQPTTFTAKKPRTLPIVEVAEKVSEKEAMKHPTTFTTKKPPPVPIVEVAEKVSEKEKKAVKQPTTFTTTKPPQVPIVEAVVEEGPVPSVKKEAPPVPPLLFFTGHPISATVKTDKVTGGEIPQTCFPTPLQRQFDVSDIPRPGLFNPRKVCTVLQQDCMTLNMGPPLNQLRRILPSWQQQERREN